MKIESQNKMILKDLIAGDKLTPLSMLNRYSSLRASARIFNLRKDGWNIITTMITISSSGKHVAQYSLDVSDDDNFKKLYESNL